MDEILIRTDFPREVREIENTWIPMPDGTLLAARIWLPKDAEEDPVPAILEYLPYRKRDGTVERDHLTHPYFAGFGYAGVRVDMRGTGDSEGVCLGEYLAQEQDDCLAVIAWLAEQPWCSGKVGMIGISWGGFNGLQVAARRPSALGAVISLCSTDDRYADDIHFMGGCMLTDKLSWGATAFSIANTPPDPAIVGEGRWRDMWLERLENNGLWMLDWFRHQRRDAFYAHGSVCEDYSDISIPVYMVGGWADGYTNAILRTLQHLPGPRKGLIGPWGHKYPHFAKPGPRIGFLQECLRWWDQHLKCHSTGIMDEPELRAWIQDPSPPAPHHQTRPGYWVAEPSWRDAAPQIWSLYPNASGMSDEPDPSALSICSPETAGAGSGVWCIYGLDPDGPLDQNTEAGLMTSFETEPLQEDIALLGFPHFRAEVESSTAQANLAATLSSLDDEGRATLISYGVLNLAHRDGHSDPKPMPHGQPETISVQLNACGQRISKGQRLRLSLSSAYWPVIWPAQDRAKLTLTGARLDLPVRAIRDSDRALPEFPGPESATPMATKTLTEGSFRRTRTIDQVTGVETTEMHSATGAETHLHTGITVDYENTATFSIHPGDPNSATGLQRWRKSYARGEWKANLRTEVSVRALAEVWRIEASLTAEDKDGIVLRRQWSEDVARDFV
ncbi:MAG: CocE/NonD family hydrolase [Pseudomonadota bacterium]